MTKNKVKKILIVIPNFDYGGTNKVLESMMAYLRINNNLQIDIFCMKHGGPLEEQFKNYNVVRENKYLSAMFSGKSDLQRKTFTERFQALLYKSFFKLLGGSKKNHVYAVTAKKLLGYDTVVAFQEGRATEFVSYISCMHKIAWIHCDYDRYAELVNRDEAEIYKNYKNIVCVSKYTAEIFKNHYPQYSHKTLAIHNIMDDRAILERAKAEIDDERFIKGKDFTIISVGRMDKVKQFEIIPKIVSELKQGGLQIRWYLISPDGTQNKIVKNEIKKHSVENEFVLLGDKLNPYPYIAASDLLCCTSLSEACPNVINEAKILHVPVITTDFGSAKEFIGAGDYGYRVDKDEIADTILRLYKIKEEFETIKVSCSQFVYDNDEICNQIVNLLN